MSASTCWYCGGRGSEGNGTIRHSACGGVIQLCICQNIELHTERSGFHCIYTEKETWEKRQSSASPSSKAILFDIFYILDSSMEKQTKHNRVIKILLLDLYSVSWPNKQSKLVGTNRKNSLACRRGMHSLHYEKTNLLLLEQNSPSALLLLEIYPHICNFCD